MKRRIVMGWQAFGRAHSIVTNKDIPIVNKHQVYNQCILPTVTYGVETWNFMKKEVIKVRTMQRAHERLVHNGTWCDRKTAEWIRLQTKVRDIMQTISEVKWSWTGHLARTDNWWTTKIPHWTPRGHKRRKGRQKTRW